MKTHLPPVQYARFNEFGKACVNYCVERFGNTPTHEQIAIIVEAVIRRRYPQFDDHRTGTMIDQDLVLQMLSDTQTARDYLDWWAAGKNIFVFPDDLVSAFLRTDVDDVPTKLLKSPYRVLYFKFGLRTPIQTIPGEDRFLDGAYISSYNGGLTVTCTQCSSDCQIGGCGASFFIDLAHCEDIGDALEHGLKQQADNIAKPYDPKLGTANNFNRDTEDMRRAVFEHQLPITREATKLIINGLAYVLFETRDIREDWLGASSKMVEKLEQSKSPAQHQRNLSKLWSQGFTKVHLCSPNVASGDKPGSGNEVEPHWRRGHWRRQPYGVELSLLKLIWIRPTIVRRDRGEPEKGHVYEA